MNTSVPSFNRVKNERAEANLNAFLRALDVHNHDSVSEKKVGGYKNDASDGVPCLRAIDLIARERARLSKILGHPSPIQNETIDEIVRFSFPRLKHVGPRDERRPVFAKPRNYAIRKKRMKKLKAEFARTNKLPNPYALGCYHFIIEALKSLGPNRQHRYLVLRTRFEELMGAGRWRRFAYREGGRHRPKEVDDMEADVQKRLHCNCRVLQRTKNYGLKLFQVGQCIMRSRGCVIDLIYRAGWIYRLNTNAARPQYKPPPRLYRYS